MNDQYYGITRLPSSVDDEGAVTVTVALSGEFDLGACDDLREVLFGTVSVEGISRVDVDFTNVVFIDSETVNVLLQAYSQAQTRGLDFRLVGARGVVRRVLDVMGLYGITASSRGQQVEP